jgi:hypothetical protein
MANDYFKTMLPRRVRTDGFIDPCIPTLAAKPPSGLDWARAELEAYRSRPWWPRLTG